MVVLIVLGNNFDASASGEKCLVTLSVLVTFNYSLLMGVMEAIAIDRPFDVCWNVIEILLYSGKNPYPFSESLYQT